MIFICCIFSLLTFIGEGCVFSAFIGEVVLCGACGYWWKHGCMFVCTIWLQKQKTGKAMHGVKVAWAQAREQKPSSFSTRWLHIHLWSHGSALNMGGSMSGIFLGTSAKANWEVFSKPWEWRILNISTPWGQRGQGLQAVWLRLFFISHQISPTVSWRTTLGKSQVPSLKGWSWKHTMPSCHLGALEINVHFYLGFCVFCWSFFGIAKLLFHVFQFLWQQLWGISHQWKMTGMQLPTMLPKPKQSSSLVPKKVYMFCKEIWLVGWTPKHNHFVIFG